MNLDIYDLLGIGSIMETMKERLGFVKKEYHSKEITPKKYNFRPRTLDEYIGQENAKLAVTMNLKKIETIKPVHFIISGPKGTGKSTLAYIIANHLGFEISTYVAGSFTMENLQDFLVKNADAKSPQILFVDEIHGLKKNIGEFMYPILEDFLLPIGNLKVRPFLFLGCTTDLNILQKKLSPLIDRCGANIQLENYTADNIKTILKQYNHQLYQQNVTEDVYDALAVNCRYTPRIALAMFDDLIVCENLEMILKSRQIVKHSLNTKDIVVLEHLAEIDKPVGVEVLAIITNQTKSDYMQLEEPFLIMEKYVSRTSRGRCITEKGKELLDSMKAK
jgi:Holliday junction DNA helicase RuvB